MIVYRKITMEPWNKQCFIKTFFIAFQFCQYFQSRTITTVYMFDLILRLPYDLGAWFEKKYPKYFEGLDSFYNIITLSTV